MEDRVSLVKAMRGLGCVVIVGTGVRVRLQADLGFKSHEVSKKCAGQIPMACSTVPENPLVDSMQEILSGGPLGGL